MVCFRPTALLKGLGTDKKPFGGQPIQMSLPAFTSFLFGLRCGGSSLKQYPRHIGTPVAQ
jgi:hypothetical protein